MTATIASPQHDATTSVAPRRSVFDLMEIPKTRPTEWSVFDDQRRVTVLIPARNEAADIGDTIASLWGQT